MSSRVCIGIAMAAALGAVSGAAHAQALAAAALSGQAPGTTLGAGGIPAGSDYKIGPQDVVEIDVFELKDLNRTAMVGSDGRILLPLIGQVQAAGKTSEELAKDVADKLGKTYVNNPQVTVVVRDAQGQRITVDGAVEQPGIYALTGPTTLIQAVALAKGPDTKLANLHKVVVYRMTGAGRVQNNYDLKAIRDGKSPDPLIYGKDVIVVDTSGGRSFLRDLGAVAPIVSVLRWGW